MLIPEKLPFWLFVESELVADGIGKRSKRSHVLPDVRALRDDFAAGVPRCRSRRLCHRRPGCHLRVPALSSRRSPNRTARSPRRHSPEFRGSRSCRAASGHPPVARSITLGRVDFADSIRCSAPRRSDDPRSAIGRGKEEVGPYADDVDGREGERGSGSAGRWRTPQPNLNDMLWEATESSGERQPGRREACRELFGPSRHQEPGQIRLATGRGCEQVLDAWRAGHAYVAQRIQAHRLNPHAKSIALATRRSSRVAGWRRLQR